MIKSGDLLLPNRSIIDWWIFSICWRYFSSSWFQISRTLGSWSMSMKSSGMGLAIQSTPTQKISPTYPTLIAPLESWPAKVRVCTTYLAKNCMTLTGSLSSAPTKSTGRKSSTSKARMSTEPSKVCSPSCWASSRTPKCSESRRTKSTLRTLSGTPLSIGPQVCYNLLRGFIPGQSQLPLPSHPRLERSLNPLDPRWLLAQLFLRILLQAKRLGSVKPTRSLHHQYYTKPQLYKGRLWTQLGPRSRGLFLRCLQILR